MSKLSDAQNVALNEISQGVFKARKNTLTSLEKAKLIESGESLGVLYVLTDAGREAIGLPSEEEFSQAVDKLNESFVEALEAELNTNMWDAVDAPEQTEDEIKADAEYLEAEGFVQSLRKQGWQGTEVWAGLTVEEIKEDIKTAFPVGRQARRVHFRTLKNAFRRMGNKTAGVPYNSRKSQKITGAVGL